MANATHTTEFKMTAVRKAGEPGNTIDAVAAELGLDVRTLRRWIRRVRLRPPCGRELTSIPTGMIVADPTHPREDFNPAALGRLADSLKSRGQIQPVRVRWDSSRAAYVLVVGERRWRAAKLAGFECLSCVVHEGPVEPSELLMLRLTENALREDLRPVEQAKAFKTLMDSNGWPALRVAEVLHLNPGTVSRALALLELPATVQESIETGELSPATAYEISKVSDPRDRARLVKRAISDGLTRGEVVRAVRASRRSAGKPTRAVFRTPSGARVTVERAKGLTPEAIRTALLEALLELDQSQRQARKQRARARKTATVALPATQN